MILPETAFEYLNAGLCVLPARREGEHKCAALRAWKPYQQQLPTEAEVRGWFANRHDSLCLVAGAVSGNLEMIDFDAGGEAFEPWCMLVREAAPNLLDRLVIETTPSNGRHVAYRCAAPVCGSVKLAQRKLLLPSRDPVFVAGKQYIPRRDKQGTWFVNLTLIESRGEGGIFLCAPSEGYELIQGSLTGLPAITPDERDLLLSAAWALNEHLPDPQPEPIGEANSVGLRPGDDYAQRGDVRDVLRRHGWTLARGGENEYWRRPGRTEGWSATLRDGVLYVFSSNAAPFEPDRAYSPFTVYALLEHDGDFTAAAAALRTEGYGDTADEVDLSHFQCNGTAHSAGETATSSDPSSHPHYPDPGPLPAELFRVPGFVSEVMDHCLATAPYPNPALAFCGALSLQAMLAGRKVRDAADNRTNLYVLALAYSSVGKDWPRKVNTFVLHRVGLVDALGEKFASGEGIQDALFRTPAMLFQTDEIDGLLQSINKAQDARHENILGTLLIMYSAANSIFPMRRKAGKEAPGVIDQPCLVVYGTAIPTHYYSALSERMLTNGFFARMLIVESGPRSEGQEPGIINPPPRVLATARWWADACPGTGNLERFHPQPHIVVAEDEARALLTEARQASESEYTAAEARGDPVGTTVWGRVPEQIRKLALLYAVSARHDAPRIDVAAVRWATDFVLHQTRRMLFMAASHVAEGEFDALVKRAVAILTQWREKFGRDALMPTWEMRRRLKQRPGDFKDIVLELVERRIAEFGTEASATKRKSGYRLL